MSLLFNEGFEGTGAPSGWSGSGDYDYTSVPLSGSQSGRVTSGQFLLCAGLNNSEVWFSFLFKAESLPAAAKEFLTMRDSGSTNIAQWILRSTGAIEIGVTSTTPVTVATISAGTTYQVWGHYKKGTGTNAVCEVSFDTPGNSRPNSGNNYVGDPFGFGANNLDNFYFGFANTTTLVFDDVQLADTDVFAGAATVTVNLTGVGASPAVGTLTFNGSFTLTGVAAAPAIGTGTVTTAPPATVTVTLTGVAATPAIGIGHVAIQGEVIVPPDQGLFTGGPPHWYGIPKDEKVYLTGVEANPQVGRITPVSGITLEEMEKMFPFPRREAPVTRSVPRRKTKPPVFVYMAGVHPVPKVGSVTMKMFYEDNDEELSSILRMMDVDEELITALKLAK